MCTGPSRSRRLKTCACHVESCPLRLSGDYVRPVDSVLVVHCAVSFRSFCAVPCSGKAGGRKQALEAARPQAGLWSHGRRYVRARPARGRYACVEWPARACPAPPGTSTARRRLVRVARTYSAKAPGCTCQHRRCLLESISRPQALGALVHDDGRVDRMHGGLQGGWPARPAEETAEPANVGVQGAGSQASHTHDTRCVCACVRARACVWRVGAAGHASRRAIAAAAASCCCVVARGQRSHRSSASSHALKQTTVQAYASARSPAAARMTARACVAPPLSGVGPIARRARDGCEGARIPPVLHALLDR